MSDFLLLVCGRDTNYPCLAVFSNFTPEIKAAPCIGGRFMVRVPLLVHRSLASEAADLGVSINRLVSAKLALS